MNATAQQIVKCYEDLHLDLASIQEQFPDFDIAELKTILISYSSLYRKDIKMNDGSNLDFTDDELKLATAGMIELAQTTEDENLKFRILKYVRDDKKGRKDVLKSLTGIRLDVMAFNERIQRMFEARTRSLNGSTSSNTKVIEVNSID